MIDYVIEIVHSDVPTNVRGMSARKGKGYLTIAEADDRLCLFLSRAASKGGYCNGRVWARDHAQGKMFWPAEAATTPEVIWGTVRVRDIQP